MKTRIKYSMAVILLFVFLQSNAQIFSGGIVGGANTGTVRLENTGTAVSNAVQGNNITGIEGGLFVKLMIDPLYVKPMALYNYSYGTLNTNASGTFSMSKVETPILFGFNILGPLSIEAGPVYEYILQSSNQYGENTVNFSQTSGIGYRAGLALEISRLLIYAHYAGTTVNVNGTTSATFKEPYKIVLGLGLKLGRMHSGEKKDKNKD